MDDGDRHHGQREPDVGGGRPRSDESSQEQQRHGEEEESADHLVFADTKEEVSAKPLVRRHIEECVAQLERNGEQRDRRASEQHAGQRVRRQRHEDDKERSQVFEQHLVRRDIRNVGDQRLHHHPDVAAHARIDRLAGTQERLLRVHLIRVQVLPHIAQIRPVIEIAGEPLRGPEGHRHHPGEHDADQRQEQETAGPSLSSYLCAHLGLRA